MATVSVIEVYDTAGSWAEETLSGAAVSEVGRYCTKDEARSAQIGTNYPIQVPSNASDGWNSGAYNFSYWKTHFLKITSWGTDTKIYNVRWYTDGSIDYDTDIDLWIAKSGSLAASGMGLPSSQYAQAGGTEGTTGAPFWAQNGDGHAYYSGLASCSGDASTYTAASPFYVMSGSSTNTLGTTDTYSWGVVTQARVGTSATNGVKSAETYTFEYNII